MHAGSSPDGCKHRPEQGICQGLPMTSFHLGHTPARNFVPDPYARLHINPMGLRKGWPPTPHMLVKAWPARETGVSLNPGLPEGFQCTSEILNLESPATIGRSYHHHSMRTKIGWISQDDWKF